MTFDINSSNVLRLICCEPEGKTLTNEVQQTLTNFGIQYQVDF